MMSGRKGKSRAEYYSQHPVDAAIDNDVDAPVYLYACFSLANSQILYMCIDTNMLVVLRILSFPFPVIKIMNYDMAWSFYLVFLCYAHIFKKHCIW